MCSQLVVLKNKFILCSSGMLCGVDWQFFGGFLFCFLFLFVCLVFFFLSFFPKYQSVLHNISKE